MSVLQQAFGNNPMFGNAMSMVQGKNPAQLEQIARNLAKERGVNIDDMLRQMNQMQKGSVIMMEGQGLMPVYDVNCNNQGWGNGAGLI